MVEVLIKGDATAPAVDERLYRLNEQMSRCEFAFVFAADHSVDDNKNRFWRTSERAEVVSAEDRHSRMENFMRKSPPHICPATQELHRERIKRQIILFSTYVLRRAFYSFCISNCVATGSAYALDAHDLDNRFLECNETRFYALKDRAFVSIYDTLDSGWTTKLSAHSQQITQNILRINLPTAVSMPWRFVEIKVSSGLYSLRFSNEREFVACTVSRGSDKMRSLSKIRKSLKGNG